MVEFLTFQMHEDTLRQGIHNVAHQDDLQIFWCIERDHFIRNWNFFQHFEIRIS